METDRWHQQLILRLELQKPRLLVDLADTLSAVGFVSNRDPECAIYSFPRSGTVEPWQTDELITVSPFLGSDEMFFEHEGFVKWDLLEFGYLLPWQPFENIHLFISKSFAAADLLGSALTFEGEPAEPHAVLVRGKELAADLEHRMEAPGGEFLAQAISMDLPV